MSKKQGNTQDRAQAILNECIQFIAEESISHKEWCDHASTKYDITIRRAEIIWSDAWKVINARLKGNQEEVLNQAVLRLDNLYKEAKANGADWNTRTNILRERNRLLGLGKEVVRHEGDVTLKFDFDINTDETNGKEE